MPNHVKSGQKMLSGDKNLKAIKMFVCQYRTVPVILESFFLIGSIRVNIVENTLIVRINRA